MISVCHIFYLQLDCEVTIIFRVITALGLIFCERFITFAFSIIEKIAKVLLSLSKKREGYVILICAIKRLKHIGFGFLLSRKRRIKRAR